MQMHQQLKKYFASNANEFLYQILHKKCMIRMDYRIEISHQRLHLFIILFLILYTTVQLRICEKYMNELINHQYLIEIGKNQIQHTVQKEKKTLEQILQGILYLIMKLVMLFAHTYQNDVCISDRLREMDQISIFHFLKLRNILPKIFISIFYQNNINRSFQNDIVIFA